MSKFGDEVILHSQLHHPNIVRLLGVHYPIGSQLPMLVMEFFPHTLLQLIERRVAINKEAILLDVANGLNYLHSKRPPIIHRNIKASNILLTTDHKAKITDLSMSKLGDQLKEYNYNTVPSNPYMMPPEAFVHNPVYNEKLDVFSFGCLILHILTGNIIVPTDQYIPKPQDHGSFIKVSEWDRRASSIKPVLGSQLIPLTKYCLEDDPFRRINASDIIEIIHSRLQVCDRQAHLCGVYLESLTKRKIFIEIPESSFSETPIIELKRKIFDAEGIPSHQLQLHYVGRQIEDGKTFKDYNIKSLSCILIVLKLRTA